MLNLLFMVGYGVFTDRGLGFFRSSVRQRLWLFEHPRFGPTIKAW